MDPSTIKLICECPHPLEQHGLLTLADALAAAVEKYNDADEQWECEKAMYDAARAYTTARREAKP